MKVATIRLAALLLISTYAIAADLPPDAQSIVNAETLNETALKARYDADLAKLRKEAAGKLARAQDAATRKGDLDGALAIKAKVAELDKGGDVVATVGKAGNKPPAHDDTQGKYVVLYNETDYGGLKIKVPVPTDISQVTALGFPNDALRSIQVPPGVVVHLYDSDMGGGAETIITESTSDLTDLTHIGTTSLSTKRAK